MAVSGLSRSALPLPLCGWIPASPHRDPACGGKWDREVVMAKRKTRKVKGFQANAAAIAKRQGVSMERARAILAAGTRRASAKAKRRNPALRKVKGKAKGKRRR